MVVVLTMMIVAGIIKPIQELSQVTRQISQGDFSARARTDTNDEVAVLADSVNSMTESLEELVGKIKEEELHIRSYLEIQQVRYRDILEYRIDIAPELYRYKILKLTLQPLVENSLYHGIKYKRAKGVIVVTGKLLGDTVLFQVQDNGVGMEKEELDNLRSEIMKPCQDTGKGFGLANVNERIRMNFGVEYGMEIDSAPGQGSSA